jgi:type III secretory pathway component EscV
MNQRASSASTVTVPVVIELGGELAPLAAHRGAERLRTDLEARLSRFLVQVGIGGTPEVEVREGSTDRAMRVRVHGRLQPFNPGLFRSAWRSEMGEEPPGVPEQNDRSGPNDEWLPDAWVHAEVARSASPTDASVDRMFKFVALVAYAALHAKPSSLVAAGQVGEFGAGSDLPQDFVGLALSRLLDLGVGVGRRERVLAIINEGIATSRPIEDSIEVAFAELRPSTVGLHAEPSYLNGLREEEANERLIGTWVTAFRESWGVTVPEVAWEPTPGIATGMLAVRIGDRLSLPVPGLAEGEILVDRTPEWLHTHELPGRPVRPPVSEALVVAIRAEHRAAAEESGAAIGTPLEFAMLVLIGELLEHMPQLVSVEETPDDLARVRHFYPELVDQVLRHYTVGDITRVLRSLIKERFRLNDLRLVLERLIEIEPVSTNASAPGGADSPSGASRQGSRLQSYLEQVRGGYERRIRTGLESVETFALPPEVEARLFEAHAGGLGNGAPLTEEEVEAIRDSIWRAVPGLDASPRRRVALSVACAELRPAVRDLVEPEFPDMAVVLRSELPEAKEVRMLETP